MAKGAIRIDWYPNEALAGMKFLSVMEELAYRRIIDLLYTEGGELPDDDEAMGEQTRTLKEWPKVKASLLRKGKIVIVDGAITNERCTEILMAIAEKSAKAAASGRASGSKRRTLLPTKTERQMNERSNVRSAIGTANAPTSAGTFTPTDDELSQVVSKLDKKPTEERKVDGLAQGYETDPDWEDGQ